MATTNGKAPQRKKRTETAAIGATGVTVSRSQPICEEAKAIIKIVFSFFVARDKEGDTQIQGEGGLTISPCTPQ